VVVVLLLLWLLLLWLLLLLLRWLLRSLVLPRLAVAPGLRRHNHTHNLIFIVVVISARQINGMMQLRPIIRLGPGLGLDVGVGITAV